MVEVQHGDAVVLASDAPSSGPRPARRWFARLVRGLVLGLLALFLWSVLNTWLAWNNVATIDFDLAGARQRISAGPAERPDTGPTLLIVGLDTRPKLDDTHADSIHVLSFAGSPRVTSIPRDLLVTDPCTGIETTLSQLYEACGVSEPERLGLAVENALGSQIDAFISIDLPAFRDLIDSLGGIEICSDHQTRFGPNGPVRIQAGCNRASGLSALFWSQVRAPQVLTDTGWAPSPDAGDANRIARVQGVMQELADLSAFRPWNPQLSTVAGYLTVSDMTFVEASGWAWRIQSMGEIEWEVMDAQPTITDAGFYGLRLIEPATDG